MVTILPGRQPIPHQCFSTGRGLVNLAVQEVLAAPFYLDSLQGLSYPVRGEKEIERQSKINQYIWDTL